MQSGLFIRNQIRSIYPTLNPIFNQTFNLYQTQTLEMGSENPPKRPVCSSCSKPTRLCLCSRFKSPLFDNSISVTILQHSFEKKHPLNSTRIATLGLKNLTVATVSDVHHEARFFITLLNPNKKSKTQSGNLGFDGIEQPQPNLMNGCGGFDTHLVLENGDDSNLELNPKSPNIVVTHSTYWEEENKKLIDTQKGRNPQEEKEEETVINATIAKCGFTCALTNLQIMDGDRRKLNFDKRKLNFDKLLDTQVGQDAISNGFAVKKWQKTRLDGEENEEFEIVIPPGSALLFPTKKSVGVEAIGFEVKHLIVLDGTWAKAKRMYHENPWLKLLPHLKLDPIKMSLYSEVRQQPELGCLSTIESVVSALRALGDDREELDNLLDVFESMVVDQRRCKDERLANVSPLCTDRRVLGILTFFTVFGQ